MGKPCSCMQFIKSRIFYYKSRENPYQVLQVTRTTSESAMKSKVCMIKSLSPQYQTITENSITRLLPLAFLLMLCTHNSGFLLGDTYIIMSVSKINLQLARTYVASLCCMYLTFWGCNTAPDHMITYL